MAKAELYRFPLGPIIKAGGAFRVRRGQGDTEAIATAVQLVREGEVVAIFPEGTRRKKGLVKKRAARPHTGAVRVALEAGVPLDPGGDHGYGPAEPARAAAGRLRYADRAGRSS